MTEIKYFPKNVNQHLTIDKAKQVFNVIHSKEFTTAEKKIRTIQIYAELSRDEIQEQGVNTFDFITGKIVKCISPENINPEGHNYLQCNGATYEIEPNPERLTDDLKKSVSGELYYLLPDMERVLSCLVVRKKAAVYNSKWEIVYPRELKLIERELRAANWRQSLQTCLYLKSKLND